MPTLSYDTQAVLATDKVRFQGQEVAFVVAEDHYSARDALELIDVEYEPLPAVFDARHALDADAAGDPRRQGGQDRQPHLRLGVRATRPPTDEVFANADVVVAQDILYPRVHPAPLETCGSVADMDPVTGKLTLWCNTQAPHAHRTVYALVAGLPEHKIRVISPDIGGGFGNKVGIYPGYVCSIVGSIVTGKPVKWMEDRSENLMSTAFARDYHMHGEIAATKDGKILAVRVNVLADHGAFNATAQPTNFPAGFFHVFTGSYDLDAAHCTVTGRLHEQGAGRRRVRLLVPGHRGGLRHRADGRRAGRRAERGSGRAADEEPAAPRAVPVPQPDRLGVRLRRLPQNAAAGAGHGRLPTAARRAGRAAQASRPANVAS